MESPLFPLHTVLCPGIVLPLHIFEERYRALTRHCLDTGAPFGVVLIRDGRKVGADRTLALAGVGALSRSRSRAVPHGRYDCWPQRPGNLPTWWNVRVSRTWWPDVTPLDDEVGDEARAETRAASAIRRFVRYLELMRARDGETSRHSTSGSGSRAWAPTYDDDNEDDTSSIEEVEVEVDLDRSRRDRRRRSWRPRDRDGHADHRRRAPSRPRNPDDPTVLSYLLSGIVQIDCRAARRCSRLRPRSNGSRRWSSCSTAR